MEPSFSPDDPLVQRIASEFQECPGLRVTASQAARLWSVPLERIESVLQDLVGAGRLHRTVAGVYAPRRGCARCE